MKQERTKKKINGLLIFSICLLIVAIATPLTFALFTDYKRATTDITFGKIQIDAGKTTVNTKIANLLPGSPVLADDVVVAKDVFSESYILRAKHSFTSTSNTVDTYLDVLSGSTFQKKDAYGDLVWADNYLYTDNTYTDKYYVAELATSTNATGESTFFTSDDLQTTAANAYLKSADNKYYRTVTGTTQLFTDNTAETAATGTNYATATDLPATLYTAADTEYTGETFALNPADNNWYASIEYSDQAYVAVEATTPANTLNTAETVTSSNYFTEDSGVYTAAGENKDGYRKPDMANGFVFVTQAVNEDGEVFTSTYDAVNDNYKVEAVLDGNDDPVTVGDGFATNYQWFYYDDDDTDDVPGYFYLCQFFGDATDTDENGFLETSELNDQEVVKIRNVKRIMDNANIDNNTLTLNATEYDLTSKTDRNALITYFETTKKYNATTGVADENDGISYNTALTNVNTAKTQYETALSTFNTAVSTYKTAYTNSNLATLQAAALAAVEDNETNLGNYNTYNNALMAYLNNGTAMSVAAARTALEGLNDSDVNAYLTAVDTLIGDKADVLTAYNNINAATTGKKAIYETAIAEFKVVRAAVAADMAAWQELFVFALGGDDYNTIPTDLYQLDEYGQYGVDFQLNIDFEAVQSANLKITRNAADVDLNGEDGELDENAATIAELVAGGFWA